MNPAETRWYIAFACLALLSAATIITRLARGRDWLVLGLIGASGIATVNLVRAMTRADRL